MSLFSRFRTARRRRILERFSIDDELWDWAIKEHKIFRWLGPPDRSRLRELSTLFLAEKLFDPVGGVDLDEELKVSIASQACLPLLGLDLDWYSDWSTIIVTPREYDVRKRDVDGAGVVHEYDDEFSGESFDLGPVALSRVDVEASGWGDGYNVVIHEMAHKLDGRGGSYDGCPLCTEAWTTESGARPSARPMNRSAPPSRDPRRAAAEGGGRGGSRE